MSWWDKQLLELVQKSNMDLEEKQRYMDDIRLWCFPVRLDGDGKMMSWCSQWSGGVKNWKEG